MKQARESESKQVREGDREREKERACTHECLEQVGGPNGGWEKQAGLEKSRPQ